MIKGIHWTFWLLVVVFIVGLLMVLETGSTYHPNPVFRGGTAVHKR